MHALHNWLVDTHKRAKNLTPNLILRRIYSTLWVHIQELGAAHYDIYISKINEVSKEIINRNLKLLCAKVESNVISPLCLPIVAHHLQEIYQWGQAYKLKGIVCIYSQLTLFIKIYLPIVNSFAGLVTRLIYKLWVLCHFDFWFFFDRSLRELWFFFFFFFW